MNRAEIGVLLFALAGPLHASMLSANPAAALFSGSMTVAELCRTVPTVEASRQPCTFLTSSAMIRDLDPYAPAFTGSADLIALLEMSK